MPRFSSALLALGLLLAGPPTRLRAQTTRAAPPATSEAPALAAATPL